MKIYPGKDGQNKNLYGEYCSAVTAVAIVAGFLVAGNELGELFTYKISETALFSLGSEK